MNAFAAPEPFIPNPLDVAPACTPRPHARMAPLESHLRRFPDSSLRQASATWIPAIDFFCIGMGDTMTPTLSNDRERGRGALAHTGPDTANGPRAWRATSGTPKLLRVMRVANNPRRLVISDGVSVPSSRARRRVVPAFVGIRSDRRVRRTEAGPSAPPRQSLHAMQPPNMNGTRRARIKASRVPKYFFLAIQVDRKGPREGSAAIRAQRRDAGRRDKRSGARYRQGPVPDGEAQTA